MLPFAPEQFLQVFVNYNNAIWPIQIAAYVLGAISIARLFRRTRATDRVSARLKVPKSDVTPSPTTAAVGRAHPGKPASRNEGGVRTV